MWKTGYRSHRPVCRGIGANSSPPYLPPPEPNISNPASEPQTSAWKSKCPSRVEHRQCPAVGCGPWRLLPEPTCTRGTGSCCRLHGAGAWSMSRHRDCGTVLTDCPSPLHLEHGHPMPPVARLTQSSPQLSRSCRSTHNPQHEPRRVVPAERLRLLLVSTTVPLPSWLPLPGGCHDASHSTAEIVRSDGPSTARRPSAQAVH